MDNQANGNARDKFCKGGNAGNVGVKFQIQLITIFILNALKQLRGWRISSENEEAAKFDDVVLEWPGGSILLQAKHKMQRPVTSEQLFSVNSNNRDFSIPKYFLSFQELKHIFPVTNVVVCTNTSLRLDAHMQTFLLKQKVEPESMLYCEGYACSVFSFTDGVIPFLKERIRIYYERNGRNRCDDNIFTDENIKDFLARLQICCDYPSQNNLNNVIEESLLRMRFSSSIFCKIFAQDILNKVSEWFDKLKGEYLTEHRVKAMFCEIRSNKYCEILDEYGVLFEDNQYPFNCGKRMFHMVAEGGYLLQTLKVFRTLQTPKNRILYVNPDEDVDMQMQVVEAFELPNYEYLIMIWPKITEENVRQELRSKLWGTMQRHLYKKIIFVAEADDELVGQIIYNRDETVMPYDMAFSYFSEDTRVRLARRKSVVFQGRKVNLEELLSTYRHEDYEEAVNTEVLEKLVRSDEIRVGSILEPLNNHVAFCYVHREFTREVIGEDGDEREETLLENDIYSVDEKLIIIANECGMGKSTVFTALSAAIKKRDPNLWVIRIQLKKYTRILSEALQNNRTISIIELLNAEKDSKFKNHLERFVYNMENKVVLMLDGVDEIGENFTELILSLLAECQVQRNFAKIFVATRLHRAQDLERRLRVTAFTLQPFSRQNYVDFFKNYWVHNLGLVDGDKNKCEQYAKSLVSKLRSWKKFLQGRNLVIPPLQLRMLAEVFQDGAQFEGEEGWIGCREFILEDGPIADLPESINVPKFYRLFIEKKRLDHDVDEELLKKYEECLASHLMH